MSEDDKSNKSAADKPKPLPATATMQISLDQVQLVDLEAHGTPAPPGSRKTPPPLPGGMLPGAGSGSASASASASASGSGSAPASVSPSAPGPGPAAAEPPRRLAMHVAVIGVVVLVAAGAGLWVARAVGGSSSATTAPSVAAPSASHTAPVDSVLTLPPIEVR